MNIKMVKDVGTEKIDLDQDHVLNKFSLGVMVKQISEEHRGRRENCLKRS